MSAELLRKAATIVRERVEAATPGSWDADVDGVWTGTAGEDLDGAPSVATESEGDALYIATMHPGVGLALADWLDGEASRVGPIRWTPAPEAVTVALLIVGEEWR